MATFELLSEIRARRHYCAHRPYRDRGRIGGMEPGAEGPAQHYILGRLRSDGLYGVPGAVWDDLHRHHRARIQAFITGGNGAPA